jgi:hypothetical protein
MKICKCGGIVESYDLIGGRVRWVCRSCKRVETTGEKVTPPTYGVIPNTPQPEAGHD